MSSLRAKSVRTASGEKKLWSRLFALGADEPAEAPRSSQTSQNQLAIVHPGATKFRGLGRRFRSEGAKAGQQLFQPVLDPTPTPQGSPELRYAARAAAPLTPEDGAAAQRISFEETEQPI